MYRARKVILHQISAKLTACKSALQSIPSIWAFRAIIYSNFYRWKIAMPLMSELLEAAKQRAASKNWPYTGELSPQEAFTILQQDSNAVLVDVRSQAELDLVGRVPNAIHIEWAFYPGMIANADFATQLQSQINQNQTIIFMCRTGGRSHNAALVAQQLGYSQVYNMLEGFEGEANTAKQRTLINGWKHANLPWTN